MNNKYLNGSLFLLLMLSGCTPGTKTSIDKTSTINNNNTCSVAASNNDSVSKQKPVKASTGNGDIDFYVVNDLHGAVAYTPSSYEVGITRMATLFKQVKASNPTGTVFLSNGDMYQGSVDSNLTKGKLVTEAFNLMGIEATSIGNHEFDWGVSEIYNNKSYANFPFLAANIYKKSTNTMSDLGVAHTMIDKNGVKIGIVGTIGESQTSSILASAVAEYKFMPQTAIVNAAADELRNQGADVVILLAHETFTSYGNSSDFKKLLCIDGTCSTSKVDVVFGAHEHAYQDDVVNGVPIMQARSNGKALAHVSLNFNKSTKKVTIKDHEIVDNLVGLGLSEDTEVKELYDGYLNTTINEVKNQVVGNQVGRFSRYDDENKNGLAPISQFVADTMLECGRAQFNASVSLHNFGGIRADLIPTNGKITMGDLYKVFPFDNEIIIMNVTGTQLRTIMSKHYTAGAHSPYAGISKDGARLSDGSAIINSKIYRIITINFLSENTEYYPSQSCENTALYVRDIIAAKYINEGTIKVSDYQ